MTDRRAAAAAPGGLPGFLAEALRPLRDRALLLPVLLLTVLLTATNIVLLRNIPTSDQQLLLFAGVALLRVLGLLVIAVALLRILNRSPRAPWRPDASLALYGVTFLFGLGLTLAFARVLGRDDAFAALVSAIAVSVIGAPLAAWFTAIAVERPLAWRAGRWLAGFGDWLPHLLFWSLLLVVPLGQLHGWIDGLLLRGAGGWFWPLALVDGPLSVVLALLGLALGSAAYRRVAKG